MRDGGAGGFQKRAPERWRSRSWDTEIVRYRMYHIIAVAATEKRRTAGVRTGSSEQSEIFLPTGISRLPHSCPVRRQLVCEVSDDNRALIAVTDENCHMGSQCCTGDKVIIDNT